MKFFKGLKDTLVDTAKNYAKQRAVSKITKLLLRSRPDALALLEIARLAQDIRKGKK